MKNMIRMAILLAVFSSFSLFAQKEITIGVSGSLNSVWITNQNAYGLMELDYLLKLGGAANLNVGYNFDKNWGIEAQFGWMRSGQKYNGKNDTKRNIVLSYLEIPLMVKYRAGKQKTRFYLKLGPQINLLQSAKQTYTTGGKDIGIIYNQQFYVLSGDSAIDASKKDITDRYRKMDIAARLDLGVDIPMVDNLIFNIGVTSSYGFLDLNASQWRLNNKSGHYDPSHNFTGGFSLGITYLIK